ncbi:hypothetical protein MPER_12826 [Moniliophthora perniciosa FA553]|nr:hypothetical protein MPER_12826 [Moniliophthora perniciosa FA553]
MDIDSVVTKERGVKVRKPESFDGNKEKTRKFLNSVYLYIEANEQDFKDEKKKILFLLSFLEGGIAEDWKIVKTEQFMFGNDGGPKYPTWKEFIDEFNKTFEQTDLAGRAREKMHVLMQKGTATEYVNEFKLLATKTRYDTVALIDQFMSGLYPKLRTNIMNQPTGSPETIEGWYEDAIKFDDNWRYSKEVDKRLAILKGIKPAYPMPRKFPRKDPNAMDVDKITTNINALS